MYLAELHGKLSKSVEHQEDILTSNVFSFFKYSRRDIFLKNYLKRLLGKQFTIDELLNAEFIFWPTYNDNTEPDLIIIVGNYYLLFEAKYHSDFGKRSLTKKDQISREIEGGCLEARRLNKKFIYVAITADSIYRKEKFPPSLLNMPEKFIWTNWQAISSLIEQLIYDNGELEKHEYFHALDLYELLDKKNLRSFAGYNLKGKFKHYDQIFFDVDSSKYRGSFIGFVDSLSTVKLIGTVPSTIYYLSQNNLRNRCFFDNLKGSLRIIIPSHDKLFFHRRLYGK